MKILLRSEVLIKAPLGLRQRGTKHSLHLAAGRGLGDTYRMTASANLKHPDAKKLRKAALGYPDTIEDFPWGHHAFKAAGKKTFMFLSATEDGGFSFSLKLPYRNAEALRMKGAAPTEYGMGKSGWVTFSYGAKAKPPLAVLIDYLDESWRAVAPKKLQAAVPAPAPRRRRASTA